MLEKEKSKLPKVIEVASTDTMIPDDWTKSHLKHKGYKRVLHESISLTNSLMLILAHRLKIFDTLEDYGGVFVDINEIKTKLGLKCQEVNLRELLDFLVENKYLIKEEVETKIEITGEFIDENPEPIFKMTIVTKYKNSTLGLKLCSKYMNKDKNYSNLLFLMDKSLTKFQIADTNLVEGRHYSITSHVIFNEKDLRCTLHSIEKLYSLSYDNFLSNVDLSGKNLSIYLIGGGSGKFAQTLKLVNPANDINIIDEKAVEHVVVDYLKQRKMESQIFFYTFHLDKEDLFPNGDIYIISYYLHWNTGEKNKRLLKIVSNSLKPGGKLVLIEFLSEKGDILPHSDKEENSIATYNTTNLLLNDFDGHSPSLEELLFMSKEAGFKDSEVIRTKGMATILILTK